MTELTLTQEELMRRLEEVHHLITTTATAEEVSEPVRCCLLESLQSLNRAIDAVRETKDT